MSAAPDQVPPVWEEVRRRRVGKIVAAYLAAGFAIVEVGSWALPLAGAPSWLARVGLGALVLGFPVAVVLAWTYDITPAGVVRTPDDLAQLEDESPTYAWLVVTVLGIAIGLALRLVGG